MSEESVSDVVRQEAAKQTVELVFAVVGIAAAVFVQRHLANPDALRTLKMRSVLWFEQFSRKQEKVWRQLADRSAVAYRGMTEW